MEISVVEVDLGARGLQFPRDSVGMVLAQPNLTLSDTEPFICTTAAKQASLDAIAKTLTVAKLRPHGQTKTHFTVFPECSIPGLEGITSIEAVVNAADWPVGTVVIGGIDGLTKSQYAQLLQRQHTHVDDACNAAAAVANHEWVNCCITWVKFPDGQVEKWVQPKIEPAWVEINVNHGEMFKGRSVFVFELPLGDDGAFGRFCSLVCFDWIGSVGDNKIWRSVVARLGEKAEQLHAAIPLTWVFVVQCNPQPSHPTFLGQIEAFFNKTIQPNVLRGDACLVMANVAGRCDPGPTTKYGATALLNAPSAPFMTPECRPTFGNGGMPQRGSAQLGQIKDAVFRERGACIHSFAVRNPMSVEPGAAGKVVAIDRAFVFPIDAAQDPRAPGAPVSASVKWINDTLEQTKSLPTRYPAAPLAGSAATAHVSCAAQLKGMDGPASQAAVTLACAGAARKQVDEWATPECGALDHIVETLTIFWAAQAGQAVTGIPTHAQVTIGTKAFDVVAVRSESHEGAYRYFSDNPPAATQPVVVISRDEHVTGWPPDFHSILRPRSGEPVPEERDITDPADAIRYVGFRTILDGFLNAASDEDLKGALLAVL